MRGVTAARALLPLAWVLCACSPGIALRGGQVVARGQEPRGDVLARYRVVGCVDAAERPSSVSRGVVWLVRTEERALRLVETAPGRDSLVVENSFVAGGERVFQLSSNALPQPILWVGAGRKQDLLFDYRLPERGDGDGRLGIVMQWREERRDDGSLRAFFDRTALACRLSPELVLSR